MNPAAHRKPGSFQTGRSPSALSHRDQQLRGPWPRLHVGWNDANHRGLPCGRWLISPCRAVSGSVCRVPDSLSPDGRGIRSTVARVKNRHLRCTNKGNIFGFISYIALKRKNPALAGFHSGQRRRQSLWPRSRGNLCFSGLGYETW